MELYREVRPQTLDDIMGNSTMVASLRGFVENPETMPHAIMFIGPSGTGKTTCARILASALKSNEIMEVNVANFRGVDNAREITNECGLSPLSGKAKVYILDEFQQATTEFQNVMLKLLEDPPNSAYFIICTTNPEKILKTIHTRCSTFYTEELEDRMVLRLLKKTCIDKDFDVPNEVLEIVASNSFGSSRAALVALEQLVHVPKEEMKAVAQQVVEKQTEGIELCRLLNRDNVSWGTVATCMRNMDKSNPEGIRRLVLAYTSKILEKQDSIRAYYIIEAFSESVFYNGWAGVLKAAYSVVKAG